MDYVTFKDFILNTQRVNIYFINIIIIKILYYDLIYLYVF